MYSKKNGLIRDHFFSIMQVIVYFTNTRAAFVPSTFMNIPFDGLATFTPCRL